MLRSADLSAQRAVLGFDGFVDEIIDVVARRESAERYTRIDTMEKFGALISGAAGQGCNVELVVKRAKLGGNGPIMGNALALLGMAVTCMGALGDGAGAADPVFGDFAARATLVPITSAARTQALEFSDGKLMMGKLESLSGLHYAALVQALGIEGLVSHFQDAALIGLLNWTMLPHATELWRMLGENIFPALPKKSRRIFVDLADPRKRSPGDLAAALAALAEINRRFPVTLGLNGPEAEQVAAVCGVDPLLKAGPLAQAIRSVLGLDRVVIHYTASAAAAQDGEHAEFAGPLCGQPKILTGAGDHFNAGFAMAEMLGAPLPEALCLGTAASGYYVSIGESPGKEALARFMESL
jgi:hypothetical protein